MEGIDEFRFSGTFLNKVTNILGSDYVGSQCHVYSPQAIIANYGEKRYNPYRRIFKWCRCIGFAEYRCIIVPIVEIEGAKINDGVDPYRYTINSIEEDANSACLIIGNGIYDNFKDNFAEVIGPLLLSAFAELLSDLYFCSGEKCDEFAIYHVGFERFRNALLEVNKVKCSETSYGGDPVYETDLRLYDMVYSRQNAPEEFHVELFDEPGMTYYFNKEEEDVEAGKR